MTTPLLHGDKLTCFTAALAGALTARGDERWWRPLLSEGPYLAVAPAEGELLRFEHHPAPPLPSLGLRVAGSDDWDTAYAALADQISRSGAVVLLADYFNLPWQRAHGRLHGTHWLAVVDHGDGWVIEDPLDFATDLGQQPGSRIQIPDPVELRSWATALGEHHLPSTLREQAMAGERDIARAHTYRWLETDPDPLLTPAPEGRLVGKDALLALAARYRFASAPADFAQNDDLWQALRQRETLLWAARHDPEALDEAGRAHWERAVARWQALTPLLLHARMRAEHGGTVNTGLIAETLTELADFEDEHLAYGARRTKGD